MWNNKLIVAWSENKDSSINLHVKAFNGSSWSYIDGNDDNGLNVDASKWAQNSDLATDGTSLYIAWHETSDGQNQIYVKKVRWHLVDTSSRQRAGIRH
ncbi:hypothetical protein [Cohnella rhizosphaerae]|uniref:Uncharacterized protein n=1 Tax=Cohnella rhizosphaerae TaxID=1457232 RepID=A0A9X4QWZ1_9BACL|nr:hypothetical protein [Cohnella rhizosphaerae]MDG0814048.1 hypothetical protein [Cohnella rhizosphaerae]